MENDSDISLWRSDNGYLMIDTGEELVAHHRLLATVSVDPNELSSRDVHHRSGVQIDTKNNLSAISREAHSELHADSEQLLDPNEVF